MFKNERSTAKRLEHFDALMVNANLREYEAQKASRVSLVLPDQISGFGAFVELIVEIEIDAKILKLLERDSAVDLLKISIDWPPDQAGTSDIHSISVTELIVTKGGKLVRSASAIDRNCALLIEAKTEELISFQGVIEIRVVTPSLYFSLPGVEPFQRNMLNANIEVFGGRKNSIFFLDHPKEISLRCRHDNSEYHSLGYSTRDLKIRKITFFSQGPMNIRYYFGINDSSELLKAAIPIYAAGVSILSGALTIGMIQAGYPDMASSSFAILILPPFLQLLSRKQIFYPSSDISRMSVSHITQLLSTFLYLPLLIFTIITLLSYSRYRYSMMVIDLWFGVAFLFLATVYVILVDQGVFSHYACDICENRIWLRKTARLDIESRRTLCRKCRNMESMKYIFKDKEREDV